MFLVVSFKRPDRICTTNGKIEPIKEQQRQTRKRKKPGDSEYMHEFALLFILFPTLFLFLKILVQLYYFHLFYTRVFFILIVK